MSSMNEGDIKGETSAALNVLVESPKKMYPESEWETCAR